jgi:hypothetical protein
LLARSGACSAELGRSRTGDAVLDDSPNTVTSTAAGAQYSAAAWVRAPAGRAVTLRLRELRGTSLVRSNTVIVTGDGTWRRLLMTSTAAAGGTSLSLEVVVSLAKGSKAQVDDVSLTRV